MSQDLRNKSIEILCKLSDRQFDPIAKNRLAALAGKPDAEAREELKAIIDMCVFGSLCSSFELKALDALWRDAGGVQERTTGAPWKAAESLDAIRDELRNAMFSAQFHQSAAEVSCNLHRRDEVRQIASALTEFGVRSGLLDPAEGNDWLDATWGRKTPAEVSAKYMTQI